MAGEKRIGAWLARGGNIGYCRICGGPAIIGGRMPPGPIIMGPIGPPIGGRIPGGGRRCQI